MELIVKRFDELSTTELYEILKTRSEIFVLEQECLYQDLDDKDQDAEQYCDLDRIVYEELNTCTYFCFRIKSKCSQ